MNRQHLGAFLWLQWRLRVNQFKRGGIANAVIVAILAASGLFLSVIMFVIMLLVGWLAMAEATPIVIMLVWDGMIAAFLFSWTIGLLTDLQRTEALSLIKFLHLPVSLGGVFVLNYLTSLLSFNLILFVPMMLGLAIGLVFSHGPALLLVFPLLAALLLAVTALTYQFQGWLASLMANKRRRRTVVVLVTMLFIVIVQLPNLINFLRPWKVDGPDAAFVEFNQQKAALDRKLAAKEITAQQYAEQHRALAQKRDDHRREGRQQTWQTVEETARFINLCVPPGWLPLGAASAAEGNVLPALLGTFGLGLIGAASLWRAYRTTVRLYVGTYTAGAVTARAEAALEPALATPAEKAPPGIVARELPWLSEQAAAITLAGFRALTRAPEVKMMLLSPVIMVVIFGGLVLRHPFEPPQAVRPLMAFGGIAMLFLTLVQLLGNQFGFDRSGFRVFVLCPAQRGDILLGKNLSIAPLAFTFGVVAIAFVQIAFPMRLDYFLSLFPLMASMFLLLCILANCLSILAPMPIAAGSMKPTNAKAVPVLLQFALLAIFPVWIAPTLIPLGLEVLLDQFGWRYGVPVCLILSVVECAGIAWFYRWLVGWQGVWLQAREQRILEIVATRAE